MKIYDGRKSFYQWDLNQKITGDFAIGDEIHFFNIKQSRALVTIAYDYHGEVVADVPNILLQSSFNILVFKCININGSEYTIDDQVFKVIQRPKPDDYVYTETEIFNFKNLEDRIYQLENGTGANIDQNYNSESTNAQSGTAVAEAIDEVRLSVDQSFNGSSRNPQSGTAVNDCIIEMTNYIDLKFNECVAEYIVETNAQFITSDELTIMSTYLNFSNIHNAYLNCQNVKIRMTIEDFEPRTVILPLTEITELNCTAEFSGFLDPEHVITLKLVNDSLTVNSIIHISKINEIDEIQTNIGDIDTALDSIITIQNELLGVSE